MTYSETKTETSDSRINFDWIKWKIDKIKKNPERVGEFTNELKERVWQDEQIKSEYENYINTKVVFDLTNPENIALLKTYAVLYHGKSSAEVWWINWWNSPDIIYDVLRSTVKNWLDRKIDTLVAGFEKQTGKKIEWFDKGNITSQFSKIIDAVLQDPKVPDIVKNKFLEDLWSGFQSIVNISFKQISDLREKRENRSQWLESDKPDGFYLTKILLNNLTSWLDLKASIIYRCFSEDNLMIDGKVYHKDSLDKYNSELSKIDSKYGISMKDLLKPWVFVNDITINKLLIDQLKPYNSELQNSWNSIVKIEKMEFNLNGNRISFVDLRKEYLAINNEFSKLQVETFANPRHKILSDSFASKVDWFFDRNIWDGNIPVLEWIENKFWEKLDDMWVADLVIVLDQLAWIVPIVWDALSAHRDVNDLITWIDVDWKNVWILIGSLTSIWDVLWLTGIWSVLNKLGKIKKIEKAILLLRKITELLSKKIESWKIILNPKVSVILSKFENLPWIWESIKKLRWGKLVSELVEKSSKPHDILDGLWKVDLFAKSFLDKLNLHLPENLKITQLHIQKFTEYNQRLAELWRTQMSQEDFVRWVTWNYNPQTWKVTLYRYVDQDAVDAMLKHNAVVSRAVDNFWNWDGSRIQS